MKATPAQLASRYLPFLVVAAVLCLLVVITPSKGDTNVEAAGGAVDFSGAGFDGTGSSGGASTAGAGDGAVAIGGAGGALGSPTAGGSGGTGTAAGGGSTAAGGGGTASGGVAEDRSRCDANGMQLAPVYPLRVACRPVFQGDNGGATMQGVTGTEIRYVWYNPPSNAVIDGLLAGAGFARTPEGFCNAMVAYETSVQKYFEMSGRHLVALDGPGNQAGSGACDGRYRYFQSQCNSTAVDPACLRADAQTIAGQLQPAFVIAPRGVSVFFEELGRRGTIAIGYGGSRARFQQFAPFLWGIGLSSERMFGLHAEYFCARLAGEEPVYGGQDVQAFPVLATWG